jgi:hypothetical protein
VCKGRRLIGKREGGPAAGAPGPGPGSAAGRFSPISGQRPQNQGASCWSAEVLTHAWRRFWNAFRWHTIARAGFEKRKPTQPALARPPQTPHGSPVCVWSWHCRPILIDRRSEIVEPGGEVVVPFHRPKPCGCSSPHQRGWHQTSLPIPASPPPPSRDPPARHGLVRPPAAAGPRDVTEPKTPGSNAGVPVPLHPPTATP